MNNLGLNDKQKDKLLEMAKHYYPEYYRFCMNKYGSADGDVDNFGIENEYIQAMLVDSGNSNPYVGSINIHWVEFVLRYLTPKLQKTNIFPVRIQEEGRDFIHPVDALYEEFEFQKQQDEADTIN